MWNCMHSMQINSNNGFRSFAFATEMRRLEQASYSVEETWNCTDLRQSAWQQGQTSPHHTFPAIFSGSWNVCSFGTPRKSKLAIGTCLVSTIFYTEDRKHRKRYTSSDPEVRATGSSLYSLVSGVWRAFCWLRQVLVWGRRSRSLSTHTGFGINNPQGHQIHATAGNLPQYFACAKWSNFRILAWRFIVPIPWDIAFHAERNFLKSHFVLAVDSYCIHSSVSCRNSESGRGCGVR